MSKTIRNKTTSERGGFATVGQRRMKYGTNVLVMCTAALVIAAMVNFVAYKKHWRKDMAMVGSYQPSERTKRIIDKMKGKVTLTSVYTSDEEEYSREKYLPPVEDYCEELQQYAPNKIQVEHLTNDTQKAALLNRIQSKYGTQTKVYVDLIDRFDAFAGSAEPGKAPATQPAMPQLQQGLQELGTVLNAKDSYLGLFPQMADVETKLSKAIDVLTATPSAVRQLTKSGGIPRYGEAKDKISKALTSVHDALAAGQKSLKEIEEVSQAPNEEFFRTVSQRMADLNKLMESVQATVGEPSERELPADTTAALQAYVRQAQKLVTAVNEEAGKEEALVEKYPAIGQMSNWLVQQRMGIIQQVVPLPSLLRTVSQEEANVRGQVRNLLASLDKVAPDEVAGAVRRAPPGHRRAHEGHAVCGLADRQGRRHAGQDRRGQCGTAESQQGRRVGGDYHPSHRRNEG